MATSRNKEGVTKFNVGATIIIIIIKERFNVAFSK